MPLLWILFIALVILAVAGGHCNKLGNEAVVTAADPNGCAPTDTRRTQRGECERYNVSTGDCPAEFHGPVGRVFGRLQTSVSTAPTAEWRRFAAPS